MAVGGDEWDKKDKGDETNERQIDIKEATRRNGAWKRVANSRARFPFQKIREAGERIEEARGIVIFYVPEMYHRGIHTYTVTYSVYKNVGQRKRGSEIGTQRWKEKRERRCCFPFCVQLINIPSELRELRLLLWQLLHHDPARSRELSFLLWSMIYWWDFKLKTRICRTRNFNSFRNSILATFLV